jgi:His/Glu/Gln/Arg/opine family amino acid ABC transporter permease subunit
MIFDVSLIASSMPILLKGLATSLAIAYLSCVIGLILGIPLGIVLTTASVFRYPAALYVLVVRGTPLLVQILFVTYGLPHLLHITIPMFWAAVLAIGLNSAAYISQIVRASINAISHGQYEASRMLGFSWIQTMRYIILPQAARVALPGLGSEFVNLIKESSLASVIGVTELVRSGRIILDQTYDALSVYATVALCFFMATSVISIITYCIERWLHIHAKN